jgi:hypothetical protein
MSRRSPTSMAVPLINSQRLLFFVFSRSLKQILMVHFLDRDRYQYIEENFPNRED